MKTERRSQERISLLISVTYDCKNNNTSQSSTFNLKLQLSTYNLNCNYQSQRLAIAQHVLGNV